MILAYRHLYEEHSSQVKLVKPNCIVYISEL
jgi:hypothetical protein